MSKPVNTTRRLLLVFGVLAVVIAGVAWLLFGRGGDLDYVQFTNGFEFPVKVTLTAADGGTTTVEVPAKGRVGADLEGEYTAEYFGPKGSMAKKKVKFAPKGERKERCYEYVNVLGSAAMVVEDVVYGVGLSPSSRILSGSVHSKVCPTWGFETTEPPKAISTEKHKAGMTLTWLHYEGDGDWHASIKHRLRQKPEADNRSRILAFNLAVALSKQDPENARLKALGPEFLAACDRLTDFVTTGPLVGKAKRDCVASTQALFPGI